MASHDVYDIKNTEDKFSVDLCGFQSAMMGFLLVLLLLLQQDFLVESMTITTENSGGWNRTIRVSEQGIDVAGMTTFTFSHKGCNTSNVKLFQKGFEKDSLVLNFFLMKTNKKGQMFGTMWLCTFKEKKTLDCNVKFKATTTNFCDDYKPYWVNIAVSGTIMIGEGCEVGTNILWKLSNMGSFNLGEIGVGSEGVAQWKFGEQCTIAGNASSLPSFDSVSMLPTLMTLSTDKQKGFIRLSQNGINVTETSTLFFKVTSCEKGQFFLLPAGEVIGDRVHKFVVQKKTEGNITAKHAKCIIIGYENFECDQGVTYTMQSICNGTETFWIRMKSSGEVAFGKGCNPEIGTMSTHIDEKPFSLGDIGLSSNVLAKWKLGSSICKGKSSTSSAEEESSGNTESVEDGGSDNIASNVIGGSVDTGTAEEGVSSNTGTGLSGGSDNTGNTTPYDPNDTWSVQTAVTSGPFGGLGSTGTLVGSENTESLDEPDSLVEGESNSPSLPGETDTTGPTEKLDSSGSLAGSDSRSLNEPDTRGPAATPDTRGPSETPDTSGPAETPDTSRPAAMGGLEHSETEGVEKSDNNGALFESNNEESEVTGDERAATTKTDVAISTHREELSEDANRDEEEDTPNLSSILKSFLDSDGSSAGTSTPSICLLLAVFLYLFVEQVIWPKW